MASQLTISSDEARAKRNIPPVEHRFKPGNKMSPGRPRNAGLSVKEHINYMQDWSLTDIQTIMGSVTDPWAQVAAARVLFHAASSELNSTGTPIAGADLDRIFDRTMGKAMQAIEINAVPDHPTAAYDYSKLSREEMAQLISIREKLESGKTDGLPGTAEESPS